MQIVNRGVDTVCFNWCFYTNILEITKTWQSFGWKNPSKWTMINTYKNELAAGIMGPSHPLFYLGRDFVMGTDDVIVLEFGRPMRRKADIVPRDVPGSSHNLIYVTEAPTVSRTSALGL